MSHEISMFNGIGEATYSINPAWHGLGIVKPGLLTGDDIREMIPHSVRKCLSAYKRDDGTYVDCADNYTLVREENGIALGTCSEDYIIHQRNESLDLLDSLVQDGIMKYESAGVLFDGKKTWVLARVGDSAEIAEGDTVSQYFMAIDDHTATDALEVTPTGVRAVCWNTISIARRDDRLWKIAHRGDMKSKLESLRLYLSQFNERFTEFTEAGRILATRRWNQTDAEEYVNRLFPKPVDKSGELVTDGRMVTTYNKQIAQLRRMFTNERNSMKSIKGTWWQLLNAVTESVDHDETRKRNSRGSKERRMVDLFAGDAADFKRQALELALSMSA